MQQSSKHVPRIAVLAFSTAAFAHGAGEHLMGTVKSVEGQGLTVATTENKQVKVFFDEKTKFEKNGAACGAKDLAAGERVVVHATKKQGISGPVAILVKTGAAEHSHAAQTIALSVNGSVARDSGPGPAPLRGQAPLDASAGDVTNRRGTLKG